MTRRASALAALCLAWSGGPSVAAPVDPAATEKPSGRRLPEVRETGCHSLWEIRSGENKLFLLGTIHAVPADFYPMPGAVLGAYEESKVVAIEYAPGSQQEAVQAQKIMLKEGRYPKGGTLKDHLPEDLFARLQAFFEKEKLPFEEMRNSTPWSVAYFVEDRKSREAGVSEENGIEARLLSKAGADRKKVLSLEGIERMRAPWTRDDVEGAALIEQTIAETSAFSGKEITDWTIEAWKAGDAESLFDFACAGQMRRYPALAPYFKRMVSDRNVVMAGRIEDLLKGGQTAFCMVGMMHCGSGEGIPALLAKRGYAVTQVRKGTSAKR